MGNEFAFDKEQLSLEACHAHRRTDNEDEMEFKERLDTGGGSWVPRRTAWFTQWLPAGTRKEGDKHRANVGIPAVTDGGLRFNYAEYREAVADTRGQRKVCSALQEPAVRYYLRQGMRPKKVHRVLEFNQEPWMEPYIRMNTEFRKQAKSDFETDFYKLMNNSVFGKMMENLRNCTDVKIVRDWETDKICKLVSSPSFDRFTIFGNDMAGIHMHKTRLVLNKPVYTGMTILENSKVLMYDFYYNYLKYRYGPNSELIYADTDSLLLNIQTEDVYKDMKEDLWLYDTSN